MLEESEGLKIQLEVAAFVSPQKANIGHWTEYYQGSEVKLTACDW